VLPKLSLGLAMLGLLLAAAFETDLGDESVTLTAQIHRYAAGVVFFCVPITAALVARRAEQRRSLYVGAVVATVLLALFLTCHLGPMPDALGELSGLLQRLLFVAELAVLGQLVWVVSRTPVKYALAA
jgi:hypothetical protein